MKNIKVDISTYLIFLLYCLCGNYKKLTILLIILTFHELGHIIILKIFKVNILNIKIYPFGGIINTNKKINYSLNKELLISSIGIINQLLLYPIFYYLNIKFYINNYTYNIFLSLNTSLILFNLLPVIPLDGSKILYSVLNKIFSYHTSNNILIIISCITTILLIIYTFTFKINSVIVISFLLIKIYEYIKDKKYIENKFILERLLYKFPYKKIKYNKTFSKNKLKIETLHYFNYKNEKNFLYDIHKY